MKVHIETPSRLHFGLIDLNGNLGRMFGGIGVAIDHPNVVLEAEPAEKFSVKGNNDHLVEPLAKRFLEHYKTDSKVTINVLQTIPSHVGLGSGTQLALATATIMAKLLNVNASIQEISLAMGRVKRTGVGTTAFLKGGFVVDSGKLAKNGVADPDNFPPVIFQHPFPKNWNFIVAIPTIKKGLSNSEEASAFSKLPPMEQDDVGKICRLTMMKLLPALLERNIKDFGDALTRIQVITGEYFAQAQGGTYSSTASAECVDMMKKLGAFGVGQSSWGPALYGLVEEKDAKLICAKITAFLEKNVGGKVFIAKPNNKGATIKLTK